MKALDLITFIVLIAGGLNWGLIGLFHVDLVAAIFGEMSALSRLIYILVGLSALYQAIAFKAIRQRWRPRAVRTT